MSERISDAAEINAAYDRAVAGLGIFDRSFFRKAITNETFLEALSPELQRRAHAIRNAIKGNGVL